jgi:hypothetical protein
VTANHPTRRPTPERPELDQRNSATRVTDVTVRLTPPPALPAARRDAFYAVAAGCTVHHTLEHPPAMAITLTDTERDVGTNERGGRAEAPRILTEQTVTRQR